MRRTYLVISTALGVLSALAMFCQENPASVTAKTLDLTKIPQSERRSLGVPAGSGGGIGGKVAATQLYDLPIRVKIMELRPIPNSPYGTLKLELANTGRSVFEVPACLDTYTAFILRAHNRRSLNFGLIVDHGIPGQHSWEFVEVTSGSDSVQKCLVPIGGGQTLVVVMNVRLPTVAVDGGTKEDQPVFRAFVEEWKFADDRYVVDMKSKRSESSAFSLSR